MSANPLDDLAALYADVDGLYAGWSCPASTECCRFGITGREPYVTSIELFAMRRALAASGGRAPADSRSRRALPLLPGRSDERPCPMLDAGGRCAVYAWRPLGCRTFYCDRAESGGRVQKAQVNELVRRVKDIAARHEPRGDEGRPLTRALT